MAMKIKLPLFTRLTVAGLIAVAIALWTLWLSGDPAFPKFPPGPVFFIAVAGIVALGARWWWTPLIGALIGLLVTSGWFARLDAGILRLTHPGSLGKFTAGIFLGALLQVVALALTDVAGLIATVQNYRQRGASDGNAKMACRAFGGLFVLLGMMVLTGRGDKYHSLMQLVWGALAVGASFLGPTVAKRYCIGSGVFYATLGSLGLLIGNASMNGAWYLGPMLLHTGDHIFHLVLGSVFLFIGFVSARDWSSGRIQTAGD
jgi:hypothetical protein